MKSITIILIACLFICNVQAQDSSIVQKEIAQALNAYDNKNYTEAFRLLSKNKESAEFTPEAQVDLGLMYSDGNGVAQNYTEAIKWYRKAAELGYSYGQNNLGTVYENGEGVEKNYTEAIKWYQKAAEQGQVNGEYNLGKMYYYGHGVEKNYAEAIKW